MRIGFALGWLFATMLASGCGSTERVAVVDAFPVGRSASPWELRERVWQGRWDAARVAFGDEEARRWDAFAPEYVWIARYAHTARPRQRMTVRTVGLADEASAREAFAHFRDPQDADFNAGDESVWTTDGLRVRTGRLVWELFGSGAGPQRAEEALQLFAFIEQRITAALPAEPYPGAGAE